ncbi:MAG: L-2-amino-thiazoline-4-carboxylic acid hydrolase [Anaerolineae bacterium]
MAALIGQDYYLAQKDRLLKNHDKLLALGTAQFVARWGEAEAQHIIAQTRAEFERLIPQIPYIGGKENSFTDTIEQMTSLLALYRTLKARGTPLDEIGQLSHHMAQAWIDQFPALARSIIGRFYMSRWWRKRTEKKALDSQRREYAGAFVYEVLPGDGENYQWGVNYLECGVVKYFHAQSADEFTPYMCVIDFLMFPAMGIELKRQGTIANGCTHCDFRFQKH